jgi:preprotein translocase subunit SecY
VILLIALVFGLAALDPEQIAKRLKDSGGWIPGFRPGENPARYLRRTQATLALTSAAYLLAGCILPRLIYYEFRLLPPMGGLQLFLLTWLMVRFLERVGPALRP